MREVQSGSWGDIWLSFQPFHFSSVHWSLGAKGRVGRVGRTGIGMCCVENLRLLEDEVAAASPPPLYLACSGGPAPEGREGRKEGESVGEGGYKRGTAKGRRRRWSGGELGSAAAVSRALCQPA